jgi:hypothetical protein
MKRWIIRIFVLLLLGAIVNVAVAWGCAMFVPVTLKSNVADDSKYEALWSMCPFGNDFPPDLEYAAMEAGGGQAGREVSVVVFDFVTFHEPTDYDPRDVARIDIVLHGVLAVGWPLKSLDGEIWSVEQIQHKERVSLRGRVVRNGLVAGIRQPRDDFGYITAKGVLAPIRPLWPGFAINTVFYAAVLWVLCAAPFALRKWRRIRRGLCPKCGYDLRGSTSQTCPECGGPTRYDDAS